MTEPPDSPAEGAERAELGERIARLVNEVGAAEASTVAGVTRKQLGRWMAGESAPSAVSLGRLADRAGFALDWVVTGRGPERRPVPGVLEQASGALAAGAAVHDRYAELKRRLYEALRDLYVRRLGQLEPGRLDEAAATLAQLVTEGIDLRRELDEDEIREALELAIRAHRDAHGLAGLLGRPK